MIQTVRANKERPHNVLVANLNCWATWGFFFFSWETYSLAPSNFTCDHSEVLKSEEKNVLLLLRNCRQCLWRRWALEKSYDLCHSFVIMRQRYEKSHEEFSGVSTEADLILARCGIFESTESFSKMTICPFHRSSLGIGWRRTSKLCCEPRTAVSLPWRRMR